MTQQSMDAFLDEPHVGIIVTINKDGTPSPMPIWYVHRDGAFLMTTGAGSPKAKNIHRDPRISLCVQSEKLPYKSVTVWGTAALGPADAMLSKDIAVRYLGEKGAAAYLGTSAGAEETADNITITLRPERTFSQDYARETARAQS
jgi:PPOX class probable F420-dependent enzyme